MSGILFCAIATPLVVLAQMVSEPRWRAIFVEIWRQKIRRKGV